MPGVPMTRYTVHFIGRVQGVGFRYTASRLARNFTVAGYVKNLPDGRVEMVAEAQPCELDNLVNAILAAMADNIREHTIDSSAPSGEFTQTGLKIRR